MDNIKGKKSSKSPGEGNNYFDDNNNKEIKNSLTHNLQLPGPAEISKILSDINIIPNDINMQVFLQMWQAKHFPDQINNKSLIKLFDNYKNSKFLSTEMSKLNLHKIINVEGNRVWDHVEKSIKTFNEEMSREEEVENITHIENINLLRIILFYLNIGKVEIYNNPENIHEIEENFNKGILLNPMNGYSQHSLDIVTDGLRENKFESSKVELYRNIISDFEHFPKYGFDKYYNKDILVIINFLLRIDKKSTLIANRRNGDIIITNYLNNLT